MTTPTHATDDLDDIVYISDGESKSSTTTVKPTSVKPGMIAEIKNLYPGERDDNGRMMPTDVLPDDLPEPEETEETARYALFIRHRRCYSHSKGMVISSIVVQSPLLKKVLCWVLKDYPCMAPELDRLEVVAPFRPFIHRWQRLTDALNNEQDPETKSHIQLFYDALKSEHELTLETRDDFISHKTITFNSLWMIFEPGDIIIASLNKRQVAARLKNSGIHSGKHEDFYRLECEVIVAHAGKWGWKNQWFDIPEYGGMQKIEELSAFPLKFHSKIDRIKEQLIRNGRRFEGLTGSHHKQYQGVALNGHEPFYVDSRIMIDADAYICYHPDQDCILKPVELEKPDDFDSSDGDDFKSTMPPLSNDQRMVCSSMIKGYSLRNKRWLEFFVDSIKHIEWNIKAWDDVVLEREQKHLLFSVTDGHRWNHMGLSSKGLNILLSGPTGVGKTFTIQSLAETLRAPLFHVTEADVDLDPKNPDLESPFTDVLEMCGRWNAILLFDEVQNTLDNDNLDGHKDEGYSLLLNALESHSTAFFVTCPTAIEDFMDRRLESRFHLCLDLPWLAPPAREKIWQTCLRSLKDVSFFGDTQYLSTWNLNGRQIANAVTTARTLAANGVLEIQHLERVVPAAKRRFYPDPITDYPLNSDSDSSFKDKKKGKKEIDVVWDDWTTFKPTKEKKKNKKIDESINSLAECKVKKEKKKEKLPELSSPPPPPPPPMDEWGFGIPIKNEDEFWGDFGAKKDKKGSKKVAIVGKTAPTAATPPPQPAADVDDFWNLPKKAKKKSKKPLSDETEQPIVEIAKPAPAPVAVK
ncbi:MAG: hypothetical protein Q9222_003366 [Ikaeria aurantiellina]